MNQVPSQQEYDYNRKLHWLASKNGAAVKLEWQLTLRSKIVVPFPLFPA